MVAKPVLVYALHSLENVLGLARFRVFVPNMYVFWLINAKNNPHALNSKTFKQYQLNKNYFTKI